MKAVVIIVHLSFELGEHEQALARIGEILASAHDFAAAVGQRGFMCRDSQHLVQVRAKVFGYG